MEGVDQAIRRIACNNVDFLVDERTVDEAKVHHTGRRGKVQAVELAPAFKAVGALEKFVAKTGAHLGSVGDDVTRVAKVQLLSVLAANDHGDVFSKPSGSVTSRLKRRGIPLFHTDIDFVRGRDWGIR